MASIAHDIDLYCETRNTWGKWYQPTLQDALDFLATEVAEAIDARLRLDPRYVRNDAHESKWADIGEELADVLFMTYVSARIGGWDIERILRDKLARTRLPDDST